MQPNNIPELKTLRLRIVCALHDFFCLHLKRVMYLKMPKRRLWSDFCVCAVEKSSTVHQISLKQT